MNKRKAQIHMFSSMNELVCVCWFEVQSASILLSSFETSTFAVYSFV